jgi:hypothetical protein
MYRGRPNAYTLNANQRLWRVHSHRHSAAEFNPGPSAEHESAGHTGGPDARHAGGHDGGRFGSTLEHPYAYYYAGSEQTTAIAEVLLRDELRFNESGYRVLPRQVVLRLRISAVQTVRPLTLVSLCSGPDLAAAAVGVWLVQGGSAPDASRAAAHWLRDRAPWADGLIWTSTIDLGKPAVVLFQDRCGPDAITELPNHAIDLSDDKGIGWLNEALAPYHTQVRPPRRR